MTCRQFFLLQFGALLVSMALSTLLGPHAHAQNYPNRPVTLVVPFARRAL